MRYVTIFKCLCLSATFAIGIGTHSTGDDASKRVSENRTNAATNGPKLLRIDWYEKSDSPKERHLSSSSIFVIPNQTFSLQSGGERKANGFVESITYGMEIMGTVGNAKGDEIPVSLVISNGVLVNPDDLSSTVIKSDLVKLQVNLKSSETKSFRTLGSTRCDLRIEECR